LNSRTKCASFQYFLPICAIVAPGFLKFTSQKPQYCLKKTSRIPHRTLIEFVESVEFMEFVGFVEFVEFMEFVGRSS